ncbi:hypothetical protein HYPBUDRAFT_151394 [Hyphopichia burtonii NRRL Y-1933]|uniref:Uncharacterized protein n=1 Tax=Hyphopichia burtonii NRRL Y-1933 TaxID=984485 RepID=A0A1E4RR96_9ASCO|nr:hypothetical protein HYPBUDRAFT_151394 [Hyphopichia burtonii NRRL Y-1933]ODV69777.1 hypothetical protein HYPBUDRAFT_151394 [Hyphopichia burtonii NRRL Y-1933]
MFRGRRIQIHHGLRRTWYESSFEFFLLPFPLQSFTIKNGAVNGKRISKEEEQI